MARLAAGARRQKKGRADRRTTELASTVRNALEETILVDLFPRAQIDVAIQVLQADGSVLAACINTAMLAVADAGAPPSRLGAPSERVTLVHLLTTRQDDVPLQASERMAACFQPAQVLPGWLC